jgi:hypothetical protein
MKIIIFLEVTSCSLVATYRCIGGNRLVYKSRNMSLFKLKYFYVLNLCECLRKRSDAINCCSKRDSLRFSYKMHFFRGKP